MLCWDTEVRGNLWEHERSVEKQTLTEIRIRLRAFGATRRIETRRFAPPTRSVTRFARINAYSWIACLVNETPRNFSYSVVRPPEVRIVIHMFFQWYKFKRRHLSITTKRRGALTSWYHAFSPSSHLRLPSKIRRDKSTTDWSVLAHYSFKLKRKTKRNRLRLVLSA